MNVRVQQYYKINRHLKKAYHQRVREQAAASEIASVVARRFCPCLAQDICQNLLPCFAA